MEKETKANVLKTIVIQNDKIKKALALNEEKMKDFDEMMNEINSASTQINQALEAYNRLQEEGVEK